MRDREEVAARLHLGNRIKAQSSGICQGRPNDLNTVLAHPSATPALPDAQAQIVQRNLASAPAKTHIRVMRHLLAQPSREIGHLHRLDEAFERKATQQAAAV